MKNPASIVHVQQHPVWENMARYRTPGVPTSDDPQLRNSWVVDDGEEYSDETDALKQSLSRSSRLKARSSAQVREARSVDQGPELIMPSIHEDMDESWVGEEKPRRRRLRRSSRSTSEVQAPEQQRQQRSTSRQPRHVPKVMENVLDTFIRPLLVGFGDIIAKAFALLKTPASYLLAMYLLLGLGMLLRNLLTTSITNALTPICRLPFISYMIPICTSTYTPTGRARPVPFDDLMTVQSQFEDVLEVSAGGASLPLDMKRGEASIRDLRTLVRHSHLPSRNELGLEFDGFIETARIASFDLQKFNSHVGRSVDSVLATAKWTRRVLDGIEMRSADRGAINAFLNDKLLAPFQPLKFTENRALEQYMRHTRTVEDEIARLITEAQALLLVLQNLEDRLDVIHGISVRDRETAQLSRDDVLNQLWTKLGGNAKALGKLDSKLNLLSQMNQYRQSAFAHVSGTIIKLQEIAAGLEDLRERVSTVQVIGGKMGVPLSVHIDNIELGVQRLEEARMRTRGVEGNAVRSILDREEGRNPMVIDG